ncbi:GntR family transcriptional regulator [Sphingobacterium daejeonense]|uniref:GntR family transcriptional regulator n=1 Tax=Sphingobacterium daejeonense TaxID=371142 RepID=UPI0010C4D11D|nr:winged helix-turn-helix domain-containing protein [Sphingobacterium daejeonense]VTP91637.1 Uncharacterized HTH-type transcriptional regulator yegW [Sphingobacterium daejeonense]
MFPYKNVINIDKDSKMAVYIQIANAIVNGIRNGTLKAGTHLPGSRELARILSVHRKTVIAAYDELDAQGWINIFPRRYVAVSERIPSLNPRKWNPQTA